jgi:hypothetical protein
MTGSQPTGKLSPFTLCLLDYDVYACEQARIALESGWRIELFSDLSEVLSQPSGSVALLPVEIALDGHLSLTAGEGALIQPTVLLHGPPAFLETLHDLRCDDVLVDPWSAEELRFRLSLVAKRAVLRCADGVLECGPYWLSGTGGDGIVHRIPLPPDQYAVFALLARVPYETVPRGALQAVSGVTSDASRALDMRLSRIRQRLALITEGWSSPPRIRAVRGMGYRLELK